MSLWIRIVMLRITHICIGTTNLCCLSQQTKVLFMYNLLCTQTEIPGTLEIVRKAKLLDFTVLLLSDQTVDMRHLCVRAVNSSSWRFIFASSYSQLYATNLCCAHRKIEILFVCYSSCLKAASFVNLIFSKQSNGFRNVLF